MFYMYHMYMKLNKATQFVCLDFCFELIGKCIQYNIQMHEWHLATN